MKTASRCLVVVAIVAGVIFPSVTSAQDPLIVSGERKLDVTVGMMGYIRQIVLPGTELVAKEVDSRRTPIAVRIDGVFPHGDQLRYDLTFIGFEPGAHDLRDYLERKDGSSAVGLPAMRVNVNSVLPADKMTPSSPTKGLLARIGGYRNAVILAVVLWLLGLFAILFIGRKPAATAMAANETEESEVDSIRRLLNAAIDEDELAAEQKAELDMKILNFWRDRRSLETLPVAEALGALKKDEQAGPLLAGLERWFYSREVPQRDEINNLLQPMVSMASEDGGDE